MTHTPTHTLTDTCMHTYTSIETHTKTLTETHLDTSRHTLTNARTPLEHTHTHTHTLFSLWKHSHMYTHAVMDTGQCHPSASTSKAMPGLSFTCQRPILSVP